MFRVLDLMSLFISPSLSISTFIFGIKIDNVTKKPLRNHFFTLIYFNVITFIINDEIFLIFTTFNANLMYVIASRIS